MKPCPKCNQHKENSEWNKTSGYCKSCVSIYNKAYRLKQKTETGWIRQKSQNLDPNYRTCYGCLQTFPIEAFRWRVKKELRAYDCNSCHNLYNLKHPASMESRKKSQLKTAAKRKEYKLELYTYLLNHPCIDCGETNPIVLDFDHRNREEKTITLNRLHERLNWDLTLLEIAKCDVRCACCHRIKTSSECNSQFFKWYYEIENISDLFMAAEENISQ